MILVVYNSDNVKITSYEDASPSLQEQISALNDVVNSIIMGGK